MAIKISPPRRHQRSKPTMIHPLSPLELLPCELLISIYLHSRNPSLIFASPELHCLTSFRQIRVALIEDCCTDPSLRTRKNKTAIANLRMLLFEDWLSLGWLQDAAMGWAEQEVRSELASWLAVNESDERQRAELEGVFEEMWRAQVAGYQCQSSSHISPPQGRLTAPWSGSGRQKCFEFAVDWPPMVVVRHDEDRLIVRSFVQPVDWRVFPQRLLAGPWSQTEGDVLSFFLPSMRMSRRNRFVPTPARRALNGLKMGLYRAIVEENIPALLCFTGDGNAPSSKMREHYLRMFKDLPPGAAKEIDTGRWSITRLPGQNRGDFMPSGVVEMSHIELATSKLREVRARMRRDKMERGVCFGRDFMLQALFKVEKWHDVAAYLASNEE